MKKIFIISILVVFFLSSCATQKPETPDETPVPEIQDVTEVIEEDIIIEEPETFFDEDPVEDVEEEIVSEEQAEYLRSIDQISEEETVSFDEFADDKAAILKIIEELSLVMQKSDFEKWKTYIDPDSIAYYSNPANLRKTQKKLPDKTLQIKGLRDYFRFVFVPARQISNVDEIRYLSKTNVKAVQVKSPEEVIVYYYFVKIKGQWMVQIPPV